MATKEAGYIWDAEKKELKKIEQKSAWSEEDEKMLEKIDTDLYLYEGKVRYGRDKDGADTIKKHREWFKIFKNKVHSKQEWSKEDEKMLECALDMIEWYSGKNEDKSRLVSGWLKTLKDRVQPQNRWKPSDEQMITLRHVISGCSYDIEPLVEFETKLKEL